MNDDPSADERAEIVRARAAARQRDYYARNKDAVAAYQRDYYARNKDAIKLRRKLRQCGIDPREALA